jgi:MFS family permease
VTDSLPVRPAQQIAKLEPERIYSRDFALICGGGISLLLGFMMLLGVLPLYLKDDLGGSDAEVGLIIGFFALAALVPRPFIGRDIDRGGSRKFLLVGAATFVVASLLYLVAETIPLLLGVRVLHGLGMACFHTAAFTSVANLAPPHRRAEAMGIWGMVSTFATAIGPYIGLLVHDGPGNRAVFVTAAVLAAAALIVFSLTREPAGERQTHAAPGGLIEPSVFVPSVLVLSFTLTYGAVQSFVLLYAEERDIANGGLYFTSFALATLLSRLIGGRLADRHGRWSVIVPSLAFGAAALALLAVADSLWMLLAVGMLFGLSFGAGNPAMTALAVDLVPPERHGAGMGTYTSAFELGIGSGAIAAGWMAAASSYSGMFLLNALFPTLGMLFGLHHARKKPSAPTPPPR